MTRCSYESTLITLDTMSQPIASICPECSHTVLPTARFCPYCGAGLTAKGEPDEIVVVGGNRLRVAQDSLNIRALLTLIESSVAVWQQRLQYAAGVNREHAAGAVKDLSRILDSLSQQLAQGRETVRITTRLPAARISITGCPVCGRGNRANARYCKGCGSLLPDPTRSETPTRPPMLRLTLAACTDTGKTRTHNEDTCYTGTLPMPGATPITLLLVADGMGGQAAGEQASRLASDTVCQALAAGLQSRLPTTDEEWHGILTNAVLAANEKVYTHSKSDQHLAGMGTTLTLLVVTAARAHLAHVGDSRAYLLNTNGVTEDGATIMQLTSDHSLVARLVDIGQLTPEEARTHPQRNVIYRALGGQPTVEIDTSSQPLQPGDRLLLCSDGLINHVADAELSQAVLTNQPLDQICTGLIALANQRGGRDNISVVIAKVEGSEYARV